MTTGWETILPLLVYIQTNLDGDLSLAALSRRARLSPAHLHRAFRSLVGETLKRYTERLRLEQGAFRLVIQDGSVLDIALDCGYRNHETFTRAFGRRFGLPPQEYRVRAQRFAPPPPEPARVPPTDFELSTTRGVRFRDLHLAFFRHTVPTRGWPQQYGAPVGLWVDQSDSFQASINEVRLSVYMRISYQKIS